MNFIKSSLVILCTTSLIACGSSSVKKDDKLGYKSSTVARPLAFPPDLSSDRIKDSYALPNYVGPNTLSGYENAKKGVSGGYAANSGVLPQYNDVRLVRVGSQRFIQTSIPPAALWPKLRDFWLKNGFVIERENATAGIMETNWAENRAEIKSGTVQRWLSKVIDSLYSTGTRDKFRLRLERNASNQSEIIVSHQRMVEKLSGSRESESIIWTPGKPQPALEGEVMARLVAHLGAGQQQIASTKAAYSTNYERARLVNTGSSASLQILDSFDNSWRLVGNALDRSGFAVEDKNRSAGVYYVRYEDPIVASQKKGFLGKIFGKKKAPVSKYLIHVRNTGQTSQVQITNRANQLLASKTSTRILKILHEQLR